VKQTRAAVARRRRLTVSATAAILITTGVVLATELPASSHSNHRSATTAPPTSTITQKESLKDALQHYIETRRRAIAVAVYDSVAKQLLAIHPSLRGRTASIVKVDILETLLHRTGGKLTEDQRETATAMIENSDNDAATDLWNQDGGAAGVHAFNDLLGLQQTTPHIDWGDTTTSAADQVTLVRALLEHSALLTDSARRFQRTLMRHIEADQQWGISGGVPSTAIYGVKNGWLPVNEDHGLWAVNSIGWVRGDGKAYEIAVITQHDPTKAYGIQSIQHIAQLVWKHMTVQPSG
jgi:Beta-lactamase enzyme family